MDIVELSKVKKTIRKLPEHIKRKLLEWAMAVELEGIREIRKLKGYHDEPLKGKRQGQRSVRLSISWRAIYEEKKEGTINLIVVEEISHHEY